MIKTIKLNEYDLLVLEKENLTNEWFYVQVIKDNNAVIEEFKSNNTALWDLAN